MEDNVSATEEAPRKSTQTPTNLCSSNSAGVFLAQNPSFVSLLALLLWSAEIGPRFPQHSLCDWFSLCSCPWPWPWDWVPWPEFPPQPRPGCGAWGQCQRRRARPGAERLPDLVTDVVLRSEGLVDTQDVVHLRPLVVFDVCKADPGKVLAFSCVPWPR